MEMKRFVWAIVLGAMLAMTGCGDDGDNGGTGGSGGDDSGSGGSGGDDSGTGGSNGGTSNSSCEAICSSTCVFEGVDPTDVDYDTCVSQCTAGVPQFDDDCGPQLDAYLDCLEANDCNEETQNCNSEAIAWGTCISGISFP